MTWRCPNCKAPLVDFGRSATCTAGHVFDRAAEGYLNLLVGGRLKGRAPGDDAEMIRARRSLFDAGHYRPVHEAVASMVEARRPSVVLDAGCGEGTYIAAVTAPIRLGTDVSKPAVRLASKRHREVDFAVASSFDLPLHDASVDVVVSVFAPRAFHEFHRVLRPGGAVVVASPGPEHLAGLTELVYGHRKLHEQRPHAVADAHGDRPRSPGDAGPSVGADAFIASSGNSLGADEGDLQRGDGPGAAAPSSYERVRFELALHGPGAIGALLHMTPYWWRATPERRAQISAMTELVTTVDVVVTCHERPTDPMPPSP